MIVTTCPRTVRVIEHTLIPLQDGTMLAARMWLPEDAEQNPVPAILEYLPYPSATEATNETRLLILIWPATAMRAFASTFEGAASRGACCSTSTRSKNRTIAWR